VTERADEAAFQAQVVELARAASIGCDSVDGTFLAFGPDKNLPQLLRWLRLADEPTLFGGAA